MTILRLPFGDYAEASMGLTLGLSPSNIDCAASSFPRLSLLLVRSEEVPRGGAYVGERVGFTSRRGAEAATRGRHRGALYFKVSELWGACVF